MSLESRITKSEKEVSKRRADIFFRLKQGEFITFADGKDKKISFKLPKIEKSLPEKIIQLPQSELQLNFERVYQEAKSLFKNRTSLLHLRVQFFLTLTRKSTILFTA